MSRYSTITLWLAPWCLLAACEDSGQAAQPPASGIVVTTGKIDTSLEAVPDEVLRAAREARPALELHGAEYERRDGREYYDLEGTLPDGSELELDLTLADGAWTVVEVQRDIALEQVPGGARQALETERPDWQPRRIIESDQGDGLVIYEFFGPGSAGEELKVEVKWEDGAAEMLSDEWIH
jgi:hypothetical protein